MNSSGSACHKTDADATGGYVWGTGPFADHEGKLLRLVKYVRELEAYTAAFRKA